MLQGRHAPRKRGFALSENSSECISEDRNSCINNCIPHIPISDGILAEISPRHDGRWDTVSRPLAPVVDTGGGSNIPEMGCHGQGRRRRDPNISTYRADSVLSVGRRGDSEERISSIRCEYESTNGIRIVHVRILAARSTLRGRNRGRNRNARSARTLSGISVCGGPGSLAQRDDHQAGHLEPVRASHGSHRWRVHVPPRMRLRRVQQRQVDR